MHVPFVDLKAQYLSIKEEIDNSIARVLENTSFIGGGIVDQFENSFAQYIGVNQCISCANGTDAIEIALEALGIGEDDEVLMPAYTWVSTASAVSRVGAKPVFVDVHPDFYTMDAAKIEEKITSKTRAILPVHFYGLPADMPGILSIAKKHSLLVIEDCAQAHGATINGQKVGTLGDMATFSFYPGKNLGAYGDGGAIVTNNEELASKSRIIARLGQKGKHNHVAIGRNSRLDTLQAAILQVKLQYLDTWTKARQQVVMWYNEALKEVPVKLPSVPEGFSHVYHLYVIQSDNRNKLQGHLKENGIDTQIHYPKPLNQLGIFEHQGSFPVSDVMSGKLLSLPMYAELTKEQVEYVVNSIREFTK